MSHLQSSVSADTLDFNSLTVCWGSARANALSVRHLVSTVNTSLAARCYLCRLASTFQSTRAEIDLQSGEVTVHIPRGQ